MGSNPFFPVYNSVVMHGIRNLTISNGPAYVPDGEVAEHIARRLQEKPVAFDGMVWKVWKFAVDLRHGTLHMNLGQARFSQLRYTNHDPELRAKIPDSRQWCNALTPGALVFTSDNKIVFTRRPLDAHLSPGRLDIPCGHPTGIEDLPSDPSLLKALWAIVEREIGAVEIAEISPLVLILEQPKIEYAFVLEVRVLQSSTRLITRGRVVQAIDASPEAVKRFIREEENVSRPVRDSLLYWGRKTFGEDWFLRFCRDRN